MYCSKKIIKDKTENLYFFTSLAEEFPERDKSPVRTPGPDHVTFDLFKGRAQHNSVPVTGDDIVRSSRSRTKDAIRRRLEDMNEQFDAIHQMSDNMETDFKNTKLVTFQNNRRP